MIQVRIIGPNEQKKKKMVKNANKWFSKITRNKIQLMYVKKFTNRNRISFNLNLGRKSNNSRNLSGYRLATFIHEVGHNINLGHSNQRKSYKQGRFKGSEIIDKLSIMNSRAVYSNFLTASQLLKLGVYESNEYIEKQLKEIDNQLKEIELVDYTGTEPGLKVIIINGWAEMDKNPLSISMHKGKVYVHVVHGGGTRLISVIGIKKTKIIKLLKIETSLYSGKVILDIKLN